jgi:hypothetical protein
MAIGDRWEGLTMSAIDDQVQVWLTYEETGTRQFHGMTVPSYVIYAVRVVNTTSSPQTFLITAGDGTQWWYSVPPPGMSAVLTQQQRNKTDGGVSISLASSA